MHSCSERTARAQTGESLQPAPGRTVDAEAGDAGRSTRPPGGTIMIVYRPIAPLTVGSGRLGAALVAMVVATFCGTAAFNLDAGGDSSQEAGTTRSQV